MADKKIHDLDILKPAPVYVKLCETEFDISFIPSGAAIEIMEINDKLTKTSFGLLDVQKKIKKAPGPEKDVLKAEETKLSLETFGLSAELCAIILKRHDEKFTKEYILANTNVGMIKGLIELITQTVNESVNSGVSNSGKAGKIKN